MRQLYYRLRQVDLDGSESFSPVVLVTVGKTTGLAQLDVYPNPAATATDVRLDYRNLPAGGGRLLVYSETGQVVYLTVLGESGGQAAMTALPEGLYYVVLRDAQGHLLATNRMVVSSH